MFVIKCKAKDLTKEIKKAYLAAKTKKLNLTKFD